MNCLCGGKSRTLNYTHPPGCVRRYRICRKCERRWVTIEVEETQQALEAAWLVTEARRTGNRKAAPKLNYPHRPLACEPVR